MGSNLRGGHFPPLTQVPRLSFSVSLSLLFLTRSTKPFGSGVWELRLPPLLCSGVLPLCHESFDKLLQFECKVSATLHCVFYFICSTDVALKLQQLFSLILNLKSLVKQSRKFLKTNELRLFIDSPTLKRSHPRCWKIWMKRYKQNLNTPVL